MMPPSDPPELRMLPETPPAPPPSRNPQSGKRLALSRVKSGQDIQILRIELGPTKRDQLHDQGITAGNPATVLHNDHKGRILLRIKNELFILGRLETARIFAEVK